MEIDDLREILEGWEEDERAAKHAFEMTEKQLVRDREHLAFCRNHVYDLKVRIKLSGASEEGNQ